MKPNRFKLTALAVALGTATVFAQDVKKITPPPPLPPKPLDAETMAARRAVVLSRVKAADVTNGLAVGAPGLTKGVSSGGQTNAAKAGVVAGKSPVVSGPAVIGSGLSGETSPSAAGARSPSRAAGEK